MVAFALLEALGSSPSPTAMSNETEAVERVRLLDCPVDVALPRSESLVDDVGSRRIRPSF